MISRSSARSFLLLRRALGKSTSDDPLVPGRSGMASWPPPTPASMQHYSLPSLMRFDSLGRPHFPHQGWQKAQNAALASSSVTPHTNGDLPAQKTFEERIKSGNHRSEAKKQASGLRSVAGVGPRNEQRLVSKGISSVGILAHIFNEQKQRDEDMMLTFLQGDIGIRNRRHCAEIVKHIAELSREGEPSQQAAEEQMQNKVTLCVEGNISAGKTTFLQKLLASSVELRDIVEVVPEPVDKWQNIQDACGGEPSNLLEAFYKNPERYAYTFQNYVFVTRLMQAQDSEKGVAPLRLLERSVFSDRMVFVRAVHEAKWLSPMELSIYDSWFDPVVSSLKGLVPDGFIYLHATPETCMRRMASRGRGEEGGVSLEYLASLHNKHEEWLRPGGSMRPEDYKLLSDPTKNLTAQQQLEFKANSGHHYCAAPPEPESLRGKVFYLSQNPQPALRKHIDGLPALYLDCDEDIDLENDTSVREAYAKQIKDFSDHIRVLRKSRQQGCSLYIGGPLHFNLSLDRQLPEISQAQLREHINAIPPDIHILQKLLKGSLACA